MANAVSVSANLISIWERAYQHQGRNWIPERQSAKRLVEIFAENLTPDETQEWLALLDYELGRSEIDEIFPEFIEQYRAQLFDADEPHTNFKRLDISTSQQLFGVADDLQQLTTLVQKNASPWIVAIDGIGGIGKTSLAIEILYQLIGHRSIS